MSICENCKCNSEIEVCADCDWRTKKYQIPKFATNGDVIKALFPNESDFETDFDTDWWNAPYRKDVNKMTKE